MVMRDHINLTGQNPLIGPNADELGPRFPDLTDAWSPRLRERLHAAAKAEDVPLEEGIYVGLTGPNYETPAEVRMLAGLGGHAVGMSTVLECIAARWVGLEVCGVSLVTNAGAGYSGEPLTHEEVLEAGAVAGPRLARVIRRFVSELARAASDGRLPWRVRGPSATCDCQSRFRARGRRRRPETARGGRSCREPCLSVAFACTGRGESDQDRPRCRKPCLGVAALAPGSRQAWGRSRPFAFAAAAFSAQAPRTLSLCGRIGQCSSRFLNSSQ